MAGKATSACALVALALLFLHQADAQNLSDANSIYQVHAGGASQAGQLMRSAMSILQGRSRAPIQATYREVGTVVAQQEFTLWGLSVANLNNFKVGDTPMTAANQALFTAASQSNMLHIPIAVGSISVFYNQQVPTFALELSACILARIYTGNITRWNDPVIAAWNSYGNSTQLAQLALQLPYMNAPIVAYAYSNANSASYTFSNFLANGCLSGHTGVNASYLPAFVNVVTSFNGTAITTDDQMAAAVAGTANSIGYMPTQAGIEANLDEARLTNYGGQGLMATDLYGEEYLTNAVQEMFSRSLIPSSATASWANVSFSQVLGTLAGPAFPMATLVYAYVAQNLVPYGSSGTLALALLQFIFSDDGIALLADSHLAPLPDALFAQSKASLNLINVSSTATSWTFESALAPSVAGMSLFTFSALRETGEQDLIEQLTTNLTAVQQRVSTGVVVRIASTVNSTGGSIMVSTTDLLTSYASYPVRFVTENAADYISMTNLLLPSSGTDVLTRLLLLDQPMPGDRWLQLGQLGVQVLQMPMMVRPLSLLYSTGANTTVPGSMSIPNVRLAPCTIAGILQGTITTWNDPAITKDNPSLQLPANPITLVAPCTGRYCGTMQAVVNYVNWACSGTNISVDAIPASINTTYQGTDLPEYVVNLANPAVNTSYTNLAFSSSGWAVQYEAFGLKDVALYGVGGSGGWMLAAQMNPSQYADFAASKMGRPSSTSSDWSILYPYEDWSSFNLVGASLSDNTATAYPLAGVDFLAFPADLGALGEAGGPLQGLLSYVYGSWQTSDLLTQNFPDAAPLDPNVYEFASSSAVTITRLALNVPSWPVQTNSSGSLANTRPFVLSYLTSSGSSTTQIAASNQIKVTTLAAQLAVASASIADQKSNHTAHLAGYTYGIAVAALVIVLILAVTGLIIALISLRDARRALALVSGPRTGLLSSSSSIVSPAPAKNNPVFGCIPLPKAPSNNGAGKDDPLLPSPDNQRYAVFDNSGPNGRSSSGPFPAGADDGQVRIELFGTKPNGAGRYQPAPGV